MAVTTRPAFRACIFCRGDISPMAKVCPHCGHPEPVGSLKDQIKIFRELNRGSLLIEMVCDEKECGHEEALIVIDEFSHNGRPD